MKLLIDIGNSRIKLGLLTHEGMLQHALTAPLDTLELPKIFTDVLSNYPVTAVYVASVVESNYRQIIEAWWASQTGLNVEWIITPKQFNGLTVSYPDPSSFGVDRFLAMLAVRNFTADRQNFCCISCGTAITIDVVDDSGMHLGGQIIPGLQLFPAALAANTAGCKVDLDSTQCQFTLANNTQQAVQNGALTAIVAYLNQIIVTTQHQFSQSVQFYLTGGDAELFQPYLNTELEHYPMLVLQGLQVYLDKLKSEKIDTATCI